jgi:Xaa-Pro aminopeptidase
LGLLKGRVPTLVKNEAYKPYYMHRTGHWLGMDVHDVGDYKIDKQWRLLEPGMVLTVEPGLYIQPNAKEVDKKWRGIGIRIEDDVLVTKNGHEVLTAGAPKEVNDIEALMEKARVA